ncbi:bifunctional phosphoribosyl-AMP cyclohydrolase/phosphoribosyl-ATP diphosphatase HisIE [Psychrobium sp. 1_MG-2023]|uniref:bifunctional phosphoribosyl-AMP cyclohydrolase/phosphoribosyl-ATP diphosphatase HisIE n=1 Tax=Psychrobium sp. 1_MG-2023 TaxID=3062624 RepID=UPI000C33AC0B|nr:bifunctional phosphoribosyl-AMP cyclohydrolase/phosphoribosyl-ATP diphosphatase HisIE [Psychrobium sp. 1_MG-2023]MDP2560547.1 bifunctional phosphoribosyl-AMP cyclohydrolase/phosphoribosyl-ATP diphosphatase HisIE [Psychrobium sp. 1_MG-2023]PKF57537.1 bifunctional phosphoribosyl-AMP cyclohydrolase/phosphoribosyl-ATP diphosphatase [Alteromonadales bacterium alter-6D02]
MLTDQKIESLDWVKVDNMMPVVVQDAYNGKVLMLGYMNQEALNKTLELGQVTFFSRTKQRLWTKGETSGDFLTVVDIAKDCDNDTLLIMATPAGPTCHLGTQSCFDDSKGFALDFIGHLDNVIEQRYNNPDEASYTSSLFKRGVKRMAQKVGEEGVEVALAAATNDREELINESSDLLYHLLVLLRGKGVPMSEVMDNLRQRHK